MSTLYADSVALKLQTGRQIQALTRVDASQSNRRKCLLLHGNPGSLLDWEPLVARLAGSSDIAAIDMPGFGRSPRPGSSPSSLRLDRLADDVVSVADALSWNSPIFLIGHSHGGGVAQTVAAKYPARVAGIVLLGTLGAPEHASYRLLSLPGAAAAVQLAGQLFRLKSFRPISRRILRQVMTDIFYPESLSAARIDRELAALSARPEILLSMVHVALGHPCQQLLDSAPRICCPTLFLHGQEDALVPIKSARSIHDAILAAGGRSEFRLFASAGHMLLDYQAAEVAQAVDQFLIRSEARDTGGPTPS
jgi:pimeloyl-ACP methyl ester carboxylesterase